MSIRPEQRALYPKDWKAISLRIRTERAGGRCEFCRAAVNGQPHPVTGSKVVLAVAHLNHDPADCRDENLAAMCQKCHLTYDAPLHRENAARTRRGRLAQLDLVDMLDAGTVPSVVVCDVPDADPIKEVDQGNRLKQVDAVGHQAPEMGRAIGVVFAAKLNNSPGFTETGDFISNSHVRSNVARCSALMIARNGLKEPKRPSPFQTGQVPQQFSHIFSLEPEQSHLLHSLENDGLSGIEIEHRPADALFVGLDFVTISHVPSMACCNAAEHDKEVEAEPSIDEAHPLTNGAGSPTGVTALDRLSCTCPPPLSHLMGAERDGYRCSRCGRLPAPVRQYDDTDRGKREAA